jgi:hypothetical protein
MQHLIPHEVGLVFHSPGVSPPPPLKNILPRDEEMERGIKLALIRELNAHYGVRLDPAPSMLGGVQTLEIYQCSGTGIVIDESHMRRMIRYMPQCTPDLSESGFKANPPDVAKILHSLAEH